MTVDTLEEMDNCKSDRRSRDLRKCSSRDDALITAATRCDVRPKRDFITVVDRFRLAFCGTLRVFDGLSNQVPHSLLMPRNSTTQILLDNRVLCSGARVSAFANSPCEYNFRVRYKNQSFACKTWFSARRDNG